jgi:hypothetical protein
VGSPGIAPPEMLDYREYDVIDLETGESRFSHAGCGLLLACHRAEGVGPAVTVVSPTDDVATFEIATKRELYRVPVSLIAILKLPLSSINHHPNRDDARLVTGAVCKKR